MNIERFTCPYCGYESPEYGTKEEMAIGKYNHFWDCVALKVRNYDTQTIGPGMNQVTEVWL